MIATATFRLTVGPSKAERGQYSREWSSESAKDIEVPLDGIFGAPADSLADGG